MEQAERKKKFYTGSLLLWLLAAPLLAVFITRIPELFPPNLSLTSASFWVGLLVSAIILTAAALLILTGIFSMHCKNKGVFICSVVLLAFSALFVAYYGFSAAGIVFLTAALSFSFIVFTQAFKVPEKLKNFGAKLFFLPSILFVAAAVTFYLVLLFSGPQSSGLFIGLGEMMYILALYISIFIVIIPAVIIALASFFILRRAVDPYKKQKAK